MYVCICMYICIHIGMYIIHYTCLCICKLTPMFCIYSRYKCRDSRQDQDTLPKTSGKTKTQDKTKTLKSRSKNISKKDMKY